MSALRSLTVELPEDQVRLIEERVRSGAFGSAADVISAGIDRLVEDGENDPAAWTAFCERVRETARRVDEGTEPLFTTTQVRERLQELRATADGSLSRYRKPPPLILSNWKHTISPTVT